MYVVDRVMITVWVTCWGKDPHKYCNTSLCVCACVCVCTLYGKSIKARHGTLEKPD